MTMLTRIRTMKKTTSLCRSSQRQAKAGAALGENRGLHAGRLSPIEFHHAIEAASGRGLYTAIAMMEALALEVPTDERFFTVILGCLAIAEKGVDLPIPLHSPVAEMLAWEAQVRPQHRLARRLRVIRSVHRAFCDFQQDRPLVQLSAVPSARM